MNDIKWTTNCFLFYFNEMKFFCLSLLFDVEMCNLISLVIFWIVLFLWCLFSSMFIYRITMKQSTQATKAFKGKTVKISSWNRIRDILKLTEKSYSSTKIMSSHSFFIISEKSELQTDFHSMMDDTQLKRFIIWDLLTQRKPPNDEIIMSLFEAIY